MKEQIRNLRIKIDGLSQLTSQLIDKKEISHSLPDAGGNCNHEIITTWSKEISKTHESLLLSKAWLGKLLGELGQETPYQNEGKRKEVKDIEPTSDTAKNLTVNIDGGWEEINYIEKVDWLRQEISKVVEEIKNITLKPDQATREISITRTNSYNYICEARFFLGFELERLRNESLSSRV